MKISEESQLFKEVEAAIGYEEAVKHLAIAANSLSDRQINIINKLGPGLYMAFIWEDTEQGHNFWCAIYNLNKKYGVKE